MQSKKERKSINKSPSTKLSVYSAVICSTLTEEKVGFSGEWSRCKFLAFIETNCLENWTK